MLNLLRRGAPGFEAQAPQPGWRPPPDAVWIDLRDPTREEELAVERALGVALPTKEEMAQLEPSSRLYQEGGATFMTATLLARRGDDLPRASPVTFVLANGHLITIRYDELRAFTVFAEQAPHAEFENAAAALLGLLDAIVERLAQIIDETGDRAEAASTAIFQRPQGGAFQELLHGLARAQSFTAITRASLTSLARLMSFAALAREIGTEEDCRARLASLQNDVQSLSEQAGSQAAHITFLLDAALGLINIEQNGIIKIFSIVSVVFMPPTLVASIYGMNFHHMPELDWPYGYPVALGLMVLSAAVPLLWFRRRGWF